MLPLTPPYLDLRATKHSSIPLTGLWLCAKHLSSDSTKKETEAKARWRVNANERTACSLQREEALASHWTRQRARSLVLGFLSNGTSVSSKFDVVNKSDILGLEVPSGV